MPEATLSSRQRSRRVRYAITLALRDAERAMTIPEICAAVSRNGIDLGSNPNKRVSDALRWEMNNARVLRKGRGKYSFFEMPRSTEWWMRKESNRIRSQQFAERLAGEDSTCPPAVRKFAERLARGSAGSSAVSDEVLVERRNSGGGEVCAAILPTLPTWFGIDEANADYVRMADAHPTFVATSGEDAVGLTTITRFGDFAAEVHLMAVVPELHRGGIGRRMLDAAEAWLRAEGVEYLQVKTLSASAEDVGYEKTRAFYRGVGFRELEEFPLLWDPSNPALQLIKRL